MVVTGLYLVRFRLPAQADGKPAVAKCPGWFVEVKNGTPYCKCNSHSRYGRLCSHIVLTAEYIAAKHLGPRFEMQPDLCPVDRVKAMVAFATEKCFCRPNLLSQRLTRNQHDVPAHVAVTSLPPVGSVDEQRCADSLEAKLAAAERSPAVMAKSLAKTLTRIVSQFDEAVYELNGYRYQRGVKDHREMSDTYLRECLLRLFNAETWQALFERAQLLGVPQQWKRQLGAFVCSRLMCHMDVRFSLAFWFECGSVPDLLFAQTRSESEEEDEFEPNRVDDDVIPPVGPEPAESPTDIDRGQLGDGVLPHVVPVSGPFTIDGCHWQCIP